MQYYFCGICANVWFGLSFLLFQFKHCLLLPCVCVCTVHALLISYLLIHCLFSYFYCLFRSQLNYTFLLLVAYVTTVFVCLHKGLSVILFESASICFDNNNNNNSVLYNLHWQLFWQQQQQPVLQHRHNSMTTTYKHSLWCFSINPFRLLTKNGSMFDYYHQQHQQKRHWQQHIRIVV